MIDEGRRDERFRVANEAWPSNSKMEGEQGTQVLRGSSQQGWTTKHWALCCGSYILLSGDRRGDLGCMHNCRA